MAVEFYDVKTRQKVSLDDSAVTKATISTKNGQTRYAFKGKTADGRNLTKFCSKDAWDSAPYPQA